MSPNLRIAIRFLVAKKRSMAMSLAGIVFGVGFFIVTQAQTSGFEEFFIRTILGTNGAIKIEDRFQDTLRSMAAAGEDGGSGFQISQRESRNYIPGVQDPRTIRAELETFSGVTAVSEVVRGNVVAEGPGARTDPAQVLGINLEDHLNASDLAQQIVRGDLGEFRSNPNGVLIGLKLALRLQLEPGDTVVFQTQGEKRRYRVSAIYQTGVTDIDGVVVYMHMTAARSLLRIPHGVTFMQINVKDRDRAPAIAAHIEKVLQHNAISWQEREKVWLDVFRALRISSAITVSTIILISGLGMFNTLAMVVMEKTKEISILRSMGYTRRDISNIFLWQGVLVLCAGSLLGSGLGAGLTFGVSNLPIRVRGIFSTDSFVVNWSGWHYVAAVLTAVIVVMFASLIPARRAARLEPGDVIRGTAQ
ncbi:MAG: FtsX-like permease family protein [Opitutaceae bacterium]